MRSGLPCRLGQIAVCVLMSCRIGAANDYPIRPVPFTDVEIVAGFWGPRLETNRITTVWSNFRKCEETGRLSNFAKAGGRVAGGFEGIFFNDSDVFKVIEGASYTLAQHHDPKLDSYLDALIADIAAAQEDNGYLYTARTVNDPAYDYPGKQGRWTDLAHGHELYNVGHLYEGAVAHYQATGKRTLLAVALKNADLIHRVFGLGPGQRVDVPGHEEIEIGLVKLYRVTGEQRYLDLAKFFIDMRGRKDRRKQLYGEYCQDHLPVAEQAEAVGHAVRAGYLYSGVADVAALTGDDRYVTALDRIWENTVSKKLYLTGGIGARRSGEAFGDDYELPNRTAYNETCAAIANALWNHRMFLLHGDAKYIDVLERVMYNGFLVGVSLKGDTFFYPNPLACDGHYAFNHGHLERSAWFGCSCCPVNVVRFMPSIAGMVYAQRKQVGYVNLYIAGSGKLGLDGTTVRLTQRTDYPWNGDVKIVVEPQRPTDFELRLRIPGWARGRPVPSDLYRYLDGDGDAPTLRVNGEPVALTMESGFAVLRRGWSPGDAIDLHLPMPVRRVLCKEDVQANRGRVALERGPIVYCIEGADHDGHVLNVALPDNAAIRPEMRSDLLGGITVLRGNGQAVGSNENGRRVVRAIELTAIPYYAWCHRGANEMAVWLPRDAEAVPPPPLTAGFRASGSHCFSNDTIGALNDGLLPASSSDHGIPRMTWWSHKGTAEWLQYDLPKPMKITSVDVYWFDDTGRGGCRVPQSWRLLYRDGNTWKPVANPRGFGVQKDRFNEARFDDVQTEALRLEVQLQPGFSGGVLEWRVNAS
ncbi:MAG: glycoside hydrolase family 127 protein [Phycisphaerae bacterium]|nr:glycoside hydrolase family 127 protein [Phycisphaerae bacterium]